MDDPRVERGRAIAKSKKLRQAPDGSWVVLSQTLPKVRYVVRPENDTCSCPDYGQWELPCKHLYAVKFACFPEQLEIDHEGSEVVRPTYSQDWPAYNAAQVNEKDHFQTLLRSLCDGIPQPEQRKGRPRLLLSDMVYACTMKVYTTVSGRRASTDIRECVAKGLIDKAPHYNSVSNYLGKPELTPILVALIERAASPLKAIESEFAVDATGFGTCTYTRWFDHKYGKEQRHQIWLKAHAMVGTKTNVVTAIEVTEGSRNDSPEFAGLVAATMKTFNIQEVSADKAYLSHRNLEAVANAGAKPFIPFKSNNKGEGEGSEHWQKLWHLFWFKRDEFSKHYHLRSNVESTFSAIKRKFGGSLRSKDFTSQVNEVLCKVLAYNIVVLVHEMYELGIKPDFSTVGLTG